MSQVVVKRPRRRLQGEQNFIEKILVALDGSESADKALDFALDLAQKYLASIVLLSIIQPVIVPMISYPATRVRSVSSVPPAAIGFYSKGFRAGHKKVLSQALKKAKKIRPKLEVSTKLVEGRPSDKIIEAAKEGNFDIIVMGSRGLGGIKEFFLGSVSDRVADEAPCPVLIVK
ncbi:universal stress protein [Candidatus Bathyarchaeota archaeon]|nr:universal stress protein [Candidatus Bathyarchaeota archaeon]